MKKIKIKYVDPVNDPKIERLNILTWIFLSTSALIFAYLLWEGGI